MFIIKVYSIFSAAKLACPASDRVRGQEAGRVWSQAEMDSGEGGFSRGLDFGKRSQSPIIINENYNPAATDRTAEAQSTRKTNGRRRLLLRYSALFLSVYK